MASALMTALQQEDGLNNIWTASSDGDVEKVKGFLAAGININAQDETGYSPLHGATSYSHIELIRLLLSKGANVNLRDADGDTPLHGCEEPAVAQILIDAGAEIDAKNTEGKTPLEVAAEDEREAMVGFLGTLYIQKQVPSATVDISFKDEDAMQTDGGASSQSIFDASGKRQKA